MSCKQRITEEKNFSVEPAINKHSSWDKLCLGSSKWDGENESESDIEKILNFHSSVIPAWIEHRARRHICEIFSVYISCVLVGWKKDVLGSRISCEPSPSTPPNAKAIIVTSTTLDGFPFSLISSRINSSEKHVVIRCLKTVYVQLINVPLPPHTA